MRPSKAGKAVPVTIVTFWTTDGIVIYSQTRTEILREGSFAATKHISVRGRPSGSSEVKVTFGEKVRSNDAKFYAEQKLKELQRLGFAAGIYDYESLALIDRHGG